MRRRIMSYEEEDTCHMRRKLDMCIVHVCYVFGTCLLVLGFAHLVHVASHVCFVLCALFA
jgi:hypothetical protein